MIVRSRGEAENVCAATAAVQTPRRIFCVHGTFVVRNQPTSQLRSCSCGSLQKDRRRMRSKDLNWLLAPRFVAVPTYVDEFQSKEMPLLDSRAPDPSGSALCCCSLLRPFYLSPLLASREPQEARRESICIMN